MTRRIGHYKFLRVLGAGSQSTVKLAQHDDGKQYAIKIIKSSQLKDDEDEMLRREIAIQKKLRHPNILQLVEVLATDNHVYIVLEVAENGDVENAIAKAKIHTKHGLEIEVARKYFREMIQALAYCRKKNVAHRDLKPANMLLDAEGHVKISDFGFSKQQTVNLLTTACGTPHYVAPDVLQGGSYDGFCTDMWSCGVVLYQMIAGHVPFDHPNSLAAIYDLILVAKYTMDSCIPEGAQDLIRHLLEVDPAKRYTVDDVMAHEWYLEGLQEAYGSFPPGTVPPTGGAGGGAVSPGAAAGRGDPRSRHYHNPLVDLKPDQLTESDIRAAIFNAGDMSDCEDATGRSPSTIIVAHGATVALPGSTGGASRGFDDHDDARHRDDETATTSSHKNPLWTPRSSEDSGEGPPTATTKTAAAETRRDPSTTSSQGSRHRGSPPPPPVSGGGSESTEARPPPPQQQPHETPHPVEQTDGATHHHQSRQAAVPEPAPARKQPANSTCCCVVS